MNTSSIVQKQERLNELWRPCEQRTSRDQLYPLPSERGEYERSYFEHHVLKVAFGRTFFAPLQQPVSILDMGCGRGAWAFEICHTFPHARVVGFDMHATQCPNPPTNYRFIQGSLLQPLPFADQSFDYVHQRLMWATIPAQRWRSVLKELVRVTLPGGYIELVEVAPGLETMGPATSQLLGWVHDAEQRSGIDINLMLHLPTLLDLVGAVTFYQRVVWLPLGSSHGHGGRLMEQNVGTLFASLATPVQEQLSLVPGSYRQGWEWMMDEWRRRSTFCPFVITLAQKPTLSVRSRHLLSLQASLLAL